MPINKSKTMTKEEFVKKYSGAFPDTLGRTLWKTWAELDADMSKDLDELINSNKHNNNMPAEKFFGVGCNPSEGVEIIKGDETLRNNKINIVVIGNRRIGMCQEVFRIAKGNASSKKNLWDADGKSFNLTDINISKPAPLDLKSLIPEIPFVAPLTRAERRKDKRKK